MNARFPGAAVVVALTIPMAGCVVPRPSYGDPWLHRSFYEEPRRELPRSVAVLPARAVTWTLREENNASWHAFDAEATARRARGLDKALGSWASSQGAFDLHEMPVLEPEELDILDAHLRLFPLVARAATGAGNGQGTPSFKLREFDYTLGPGLAWLVDRTGAEAGLFAFAEGIESSRHVYVALVELSSGDVLWLDDAKDPGLRNDEETALRELVERAWKRYPGLNEFALVRKTS
jgi:hypothetical protein